MILPSFPRLLDTVLGGQPLPAEWLDPFFSAILTAELGETETACLLVALRARGERPDELAAAARCLRERMIRLDVPGDVLDTCGTGGDGSGTFNISTAAALVIAATGVPVVKHGNRAVSSRSGSADVLAALGVPVERGPEWAARCFAAGGLAFCFAPQYHPVLATLAPLRRKLGVRTLVNLLGPLANPAGAAFQLLGVGKPELLDTLAATVQLLGTRRTVLVCGHDGSDEVLLNGPTQVRTVTSAGISASEWTPADFDLEPCPTAELAADGPDDSAAIIRAVLAGRPGPARRVVLANAAAGLLAAGRVADLRAGVMLAADTIDAGRPLPLLELLQTA